MNPLSWVGVNLRLTIIAPDDTVCKTKDKNVKTPTLGRLASESTVDFGLPGLRNSVFLRGWIQK